MPYVTVHQLALLSLSIALFAISMGLSLARIGGEKPALGLASKICIYFATLVGIAVLIWHSAARGSWLPLEDNFDAFTWLGLLLALFIIYTQRVHPLRGLDWFILPIIVLLLLAAEVFGKAKPREYKVISVWSWAHRVTAYGGAVAFAVAGAVGAMYLIVHRRLRSKKPSSAPAFGSLERLERLTQTSVTLGFSLLTIGAITGTLMIEQGHSVPVYKVVMVGIVWVLYALVLHTPINPSFRGPKAAILSVLGFLLMIGVLIAVQFMPNGS